MIERHSRYGWSTERPHLLFCLVYRSSWPYLSCYWSQPHRWYHHQLYLLVLPFLSLEHTHLSFIIHNATVCLSCDSFLPSILSPQSLSVNLLDSCCYIYSMSNLWNILVISNCSVQNQLESYMYKIVVLWMWWHWFNYASQHSYWQVWSAAGSFLILIPILTLLAHLDSHSCLQSQFNQQWLFHVYTWLYSVVRSSWLPVWSDGTFKYIKKILEQFYTSESNILQ